MEEGSDGVLGNVVEEIVEQIMGSRFSPTSPNDDRLRFERLQVQRIRELDMEQLEVEDADSDFGSILSDNGSSIAGHGDGGGGARGGFTFDTNLASMHTYLGEVEDVTSCRTFADGGAVLTLAMFYLEGIVLFPEDTLPLRVLQPRFLAAVDHARHSVEAPNLLGVIHVRTRPQDGQVHVASVGTTAEIRQLRQLANGSMNVVAKGRQRFQVCNAWTQADGVLFAQVQIIEEQTPLHIPRDSFGLLASVPVFESGKVPRVAATSPLPYELSDDETAECEVSDSDSGTEEDRRVHHSGLQTLGHDREGNAVGEGLQRVENPDSEEMDHQEQGAPVAQDSGSATGVERLLEGSWGGACKAWAVDESKWRWRAQRTAWPHWVYRQFDAYELARRAADMLRQIADLPRLEAMVRTPTLLSYYIASNMPLQDATRQELLEVDGTVHRLRREIELLENMDQLRCKCCSAIIARRSDMLVMSSDGPISAYVNTHGYVHETLTLARARGLILAGQPQTANSWFPGYAWILAECTACAEHMGWRFIAVSKETRPKAFWGIRRSQLAENS
ncbi:unnamed protein product [Sphagnum troendelagicum]|uniref:Protein cereblon n=1 Tax=Sphagnum troendelagicum TaxID=128251 RepID=A0ABP0UQB6_9BRYO